MQDSKKSDEIRFYLDRTVDAAVMIIKSIVDNPRIPTQDQIQALRHIADMHGSLSLEMQKCIHGQTVSLSLKTHAEKCPS